MQALVLQDSEEGFGKVDDGSKNRSKADILIFGGEGVLIQSPVRFCSYFSGGREL